MTTHFVLIARLVVFFLLLLAGIHALSVYWVGLIGQDIIGDWLKLAATFYVLPAGLYGTLMHKYNELRSLEGIPEHNRHRLDKTMDRSVWRTYIWIVGLAVAAVVATTTPLTVNNPLVHDYHVVFALDLLIFFVVLTLLTPLQFIRVEKIRRQARERQARDARLAGQLAQMRKAREAGYTPDPALDTHTRVATFHLDLC